MDLTRPPDAAAVRHLWEAIDRCAVLVFHDQRLSDEQLREFAGKFGRLEIGRSVAESGKRRLALPEIGISNLSSIGAVDADQRRQIGSRRLARRENSDRETHAATAKPDKYSIRQSICGTSLLLKIFEQYHRSILSKLCAMFVGGHTPDD